MVTLLVYWSLLTSGELSVAFGFMLSYFHEKVFDSLLWFPVKSVNSFSFTTIDNFSPLLTEVLFVNVPQYVVLSFVVNSLSVPFSREILFFVNVLTYSETVKYTTTCVNFVTPFVSLIVCDVIFTVGCVSSNVHDIELSWF